MTEHRSPRRERLHELLADHELGLLDADERAELDALVAEMESEDPSFDAEAELRAVAEDLALTHAALAESAGTGEALPGALRERVMAQAGRHFGWSAGDVAGEAAAAPAPPRSGGGTGVLRPTFGTRLGWIAAVAASVALAFVLTRPDANDGDGDGDGGAESLDAFVARVDDEIVAAWTAAQELGEGVDGAVVWSPSEQTGFMRFEGLRPNDPTESQYQLWIIDAEREGQAPVDGGVFDVPSDGVVEIPIDAKLAVGAPKLFAVTVEQPGGVVVSDQSQLFLAAPVEDA